MKYKNNNKIKNFYKSILFFILLGNINNVHALSIKDENSIKNIINNYIIAWNKNDADKFTEDFTTDADFVNIFGQRFKGKTEVRDRHDLIFKGFLKNTTFKLIDLDMKEIKSSKIVIAHVTWNVASPNDNDATSKLSDSPINLNGIFTQVFVNENGKWKIIASQNTAQKHSPN